MKRSIKSRSQASRKSWRTRKRMVEAQQIEEPKVIIAITSSDVLTDPTYRRALPNPWLDLK
jgi:hypothetical protein